MKYNIMEGLSSRHTHKQIHRQYSRERQTRALTQRHIETQTYKEREFLSF